MAGRSVTIGTLLLTAVVSGWLIYDPESPAPGLPDTGAEDFDYFLSAFELREMDERGMLKHTLIAENLYHYPDRELSTLAQPHLVFYEDSRRAWNITAEQGVIHDQDRLVWLSGDVRIHYSSRRPGQDFEVFTETLNIWPEDQRAETDTAVRIEQLRGTTWSTGMKAEFEMRRVDLLSNVRGHYEP